MEQSSVLSNVINYVQYIRNAIDCYKLDIKPKYHKRIYKGLEEDYRQVINSEFGETPEYLKESI